MGSKYILKGCFGDMAGGFYEFRLLIEKSNAMF